MRLVSVRSKVKRLCSVLLLIVVSLLRGALPAQRCATPAARSTIRTMASEVPELIYGFPRRLHASGTARVWSTVAVPA